MRGGRHGSVSRPGGATEPPADQIGQRGGHHEGLRPDAQGLPLRVGQGCRVAVALALRGVFARWRLNDATLCAGPQGVTRLACPSAGPMTRRKFRSSRPGRPGFGARQALGGAWAESLRQVRDSCGDVRATTRGPTDPTKLLAAPRLRPATLLLPARDPPVGPQLMPWTSTCEAPAAQPEADGKRHHEERARAVAHEATSTGPTLALGP